MESQAPGQALSVVSGLSCGRSLLLVAHTHRDGNQTAAQARSTASRLVARPRAAGGSTQSGGLRRDPLSEVVLALGYAIPDAVCKRIAITVEHQPLARRQGLSEREAAGVHCTLHGIVDRSSPVHTSRACRRMWRKLAVMGAGSAWLRSQIEKARNCVGCACAAGCHVSAYKQVATKKPAFHPMKGGLANARSGNQPTLHSNTVMLRGGARNSLAPAGMLSTSSASSVDSASFQCTGSSEEGRVKVTPSW